ncbi:hypothetical protein HanIR_Chr01g0030221 [Helianthus annuus]|nr:hypothetical protein HanIR_Chr01g0030221 [Helianthus annuus]
MFQVNPTLFAAINSHVVYLFFRRIRSIIIYRLRITPVEKKNIGYKLGILKKSKERISIYFVYVIINYYYYPVVGSEARVRIPMELLFIRFLSEDIASGFSNPLEDHI